MFHPCLAALFFIVTGCSAMPTLHKDHDEAVPRTMAGTWFHESGHPVHDLFRREATTDGTAYPPIGSPEWAAGYPLAETDVGKNIPQAWINALNASVAAGKIPNLPPSQGEAVKYPGGLNPEGPEVCSSTYQCRVAGDIWDGPDGVFWSSFDDGPQPATAALNQFLSQNNESTTHFLIGSNIIEYPALFAEAWNLGHDVAVHTWSHRYTSSLSNIEILGELGWTMQLIHNSTGGRVPKYWRPPYGDADNRVRAIAKEVFGLTTVIWNHDTDDWKIMKGSPQPIVTAMNSFLALPKSPGLVVLEHELYDTTVQGFIQSYPAIKGNGWQFKSFALIGQSNGIDPYQNSAGPQAPVIPAGVLLGTKANMTTSATTAPTALPDTTAGSFGDQQVQSNSGTWSKVAKLKLLLGTTAMALVLV